MVSTHDELKSLVAKELGKFLPAHVTKCVHKQSQDLRVRIQALQRTNDRRKKLLDEITILRSGQLPPSVRKVSHSFETYLLDSPACQGGLSWQISPGDTIRAAKEKCHFSHHLAQKQLDLQLVDLHRSKLKEHANKFCAALFWVFPELWSSCTNFLFNLRHRRRWYWQCGHARAWHDRIAIPVNSCVFVQEKYRRWSCKGFIRQSIWWQKARAEEEVFGTGCKQRPWRLLEGNYWRAPQTFDFQEGSYKSSGKGTSSAELAVAAIQSHTGKISPDQAQQILANTTMPTPAPKAKQKPLPKSKGKGVPFAGKGAGGKGQKGKSKGKAKGKSAPSADKGKGKHKSKSELSPLGKGDAKSKGKGAGGKKSWNEWPSGKRADRWQWNEDKCATGFGAWLKACLCVSFFVFLHVGKIYLMSCSLTMLADKWSILLQWCYHGL